MKYITRLFADIINLLFPPRCLFCRAIRPVDAPEVCAGCGETLPRVPADRLFFPEGSVCSAPFFYEGHVRALMHRFKFRGKWALAAPMAGYLARAAEHLPPADLITWVPVSRARLRTRGYDQSRLLARETAGLLWLPLVETLRKPRDVPTQNQLTDTASRRKNVSGAFVALPGAAEGRRVLLVDDVCTSGATLEECVRVLRAAGAAFVSCAVFAKTRRAPREREIKNVL